MKGKIKLGEIIIYQIAQQSHKQMMSYLIVSKTGKLIVVDGGTEDDAGYLLRLMKEVSGLEKPHISAWFITHAHSDHLDALMKLYRENSGALTLDRIYHHLPDPEFVRENEPFSYHTIGRYISMAEHFYSHETILFKGDTVTVDDISFEVLYTVDTSFTNNALNNSSAVFRMTADNVSVLFLGDLGLEGGEKLLATNPPEKIKSDIVQLAHHGQSGVGYSVYETAAPQLAMWCTPLWLWENNQGSKGPGTGPWRIDETRRWLDRLGVKEHIIAKDGTYKVILKKGSYRVELYDPSCM